MKNCAGSLKKIFLNCWVIAFLSVAAIIAGIGGYLTALDQVTVNVDGEKYCWDTLGNTVEQVLKEKKILIYQGDRVIPALDVKVREGMQITIRRAFAVRIKTLGRSMLYRTTAQPVGTVLRRAGISFDTDDQVIPAVDQIVRPNQEIRVIRVANQVVKRRTVIEPGIEYQQDSRLKRGNRKVARSGAAGIVESRIRLVYEDGKLVKEIKLAERVLRPMTNAIVLLGVKPIVNTLVTSRGSYRYIDIKRMTATAYSPHVQSCGKYANGRTYTGKKAGYGMVAVDPRVIRLGTKLYIEGYGKAEAADIGGAIKGDKIDLCYETHEEAVLYGRKQVRVYILE
jgi:uncharacterized protein YabE (DUF348 family)